MLSHMLCLYIYTLALYNLTLDYRFCGILCALCAVDVYVFNHLSPNDGRPDMGISNAPSNALSDGASNSKTHYPRSLKFHQMQSLNLLRLLISKVQWICIVCDWINSCQVNCYGRRISQTNILIFHFFRGHNHIIVQKPFAGLIRI